MGHWYAQDGSSQYTVKSATGVERSTTLRDARKNGWLPSTTTVLQIIAKEQLESWKVREAVKASMEFPKYEWESDEEYVARCVSESKEKTRAAAEEGTRIHDALEAAFKGLSFDKRYIPHVNAVDRELNRLFPKVDDWVAEKSFAHHDGFAGRVDLHSPSTGIVVDYKGKDGDFSDGKKLAYDQNYQLGSYRRGLYLPRNNVCANIFVSRTHPGAVASHVWSITDVDDGEEVFMAALRLWEHIKKYSGAWDEARSGEQQEIA